MTDPVVSSYPGEIVHLIADGEAVTSCCGRTPFELPRTDRLTVDPTLASGCTPIRGHVKCRDCGSTHVMGCDECGADLDVRGHFADCSKEADIRRRRRAMSAGFEEDDRA